MAVGNELHSRQLNSWWRIRVALRIAAVAIYGIASVYGHCEKPLEFEVASVRTNKTGQRQGGITSIGGGRFRAINMPLKIRKALGELGTHPRLEVAASTNTAFFTAGT
jgi:hypothetical protein